MTARETRNGRGSIVYNRLQSKSRKIAVATFNHFMKTIGVPGRFKARKSFANPRRQTLPFDRRPRLVVWGSIQCPFRYA